MMVNSIKLTLFFTRGVSLQVWHDMGMLEREIAIYERLRDEGVDVTFVTFGNSSDLKFSNLLQGIHICCNRFNLPAKLYEKLLPMLHKRAFADCSIIKTNQTDGADLALKMAMKFKKPLIARCGYMWSEFTAKQQGMNSKIHKFTLEVEKEIFQAAQKVVVTTPMMKEDILGRQIVDAEKIDIIPNYVLTNVFKPIKVKKDIDVLFIGRLSQQKNVEALLDAVSDLDIKVTIIGQGDLKEKLYSRSIAGFAKISWIDRVANKDIPVYVNRAKIFILPSLYEGHPKTLIEAMACGVAVIGADSQGIKEVIQHNKTGLLCGTDSLSIYNSIKELLEDSSACEVLGQNARIFAKHEYALDTIVNVEFDLYQQVIEQYHGERKS